MAANENTKFQVNFKTADGSLINLYAADIKDLETGLTDLSMVASLIKSTSSELNGGALATANAVITQAFNASPVAVTPSGAPASSAAQSCKHGAMSWKTGTSSKGPWQAWMCPTAKGAPDKCDTIWVR